MQKEYKNIYLYVSIFLQSIQNRENWFSVSVRKKKVEESYKEYLAAIFPAVCKLGRISNFFINRKIFILHYLVFSALGHAYFSCGVQFSPWEEIPWKLDPNLPKLWGHDCSCFITTPHLFSSVKANKFLGPFHIESKTIVKNGQGEEPCPKIINKPKKSNNLNKSPKRMWIR